MKRVVVPSIAAALILVAAGAALFVLNPRTSTYTAEFVRYEQGPGGRTFAIVRPVYQDGSDEAKAWVEIEDLEPGDHVIVNASGRSWDQPAWAPDREVVRPAD